MHYSSQKNVATSVSVLDYAKGRVQTIIVQRVQEDDAEGMDCYHPPVKPGVNRIKIASEPGLGQACGHCDSGMRVAKLRYRVCQGMRSSMLQKGRHYPME